MNSYTDKVLQMELEEIEGINKVIYHQYIDTIYIGTIRPNSLTNSIFQIHITTIFYN